MYLCPGQGHGPTSSLTVMSMRTLLSHVCVTALISRGECHSRSGPARCKNRFTSPQSAEDISLIPYERSFGTFSSFQIRFALGSRTESIPRTAHISLGSSDSFKVYMSVHTLSYHAGMSQEYYVNIWHHVCSYSSAWP